LFFDAAIDDGLATPLMPPRQRHCHIFAAAIFITLMQITPLMTAAISIAISFSFA
jgi:hypothetical protein